MLVIFWYLFGANTALLRAKIMILLLPEPEPQLPWKFDLNHVTPRAVLLLSIGIIIIIILG